VPRSALLEQEHHRSAVARLMLIGDESDLFEILGRYPQGALHLLTELVSTTAARR
jgi:hypothetical protein